MWGCFYRNRSGCCNWDILGYSTFGRVFHRAIRYFRVFCLPGMCSSKLRRYSTSEISWNTVWWNSPNWDTLVFKTRVSQFVNESKKLFWNRLEPILKLMSEKPPFSMGKIHLRVESNCPVSYPVWTRRYADSYPHWLQVNLSFWLAVPRQDFWISNHKKTKLRLDFLLGVPVNNTKSEEACRATPLRLQHSSTEPVLTEMIGTIPGCEAPNRVVSNMARQTIVEWELRKRPTQYAGLSTFGECSFWQPFLQLMSVVFHLLCFWSGTS